MSFSGCAWPPSPDEYAAGRNRLEAKISFSPRELLSQIHEMVGLQEQRFTTIYKDLVEKLKAEKIFIINETELREGHGHYVKTYFNQHVRSFVFPIMLNNVKSLTFLRDQSFYLAVVLKDSTGKNKTRFGIVKVPVSATSRFILLPPPPDEPRAHYIILLDDVIRYCLPDIFSFSV